MSFEKAKADLEEKGLGDHVIVLNESSATVAEATHALGVEPASIAKTLSAGPFCAICWLNQAAFRKLTVPR